MAVSDRIAVMSGGVIQHVGTPKNIYQRPANLFVATFIGRSNILDGRIVEAGEGKATVELPTGYRVTFENLSPAYCKPQQAVSYTHLDVYKRQPAYTSEGAMLMTTSA